jgi:GNAT superfamily N-acetyltransferase
MRTTAATHQTTAPIVQLRGQDAFVRLSDSVFQHEWDAVHRSCPWATVFQSRAFASIWYEVYQAVYDPLLLYRERSGTVDGLLALAIDRVSGRLLTCGSPQAEYAVWIALPGDDRSFLAGALRSLWERFPGQSLSFTFLPPGSPISYIGSQAVEPELRNAILVEQPRPILILSEQAARDSLKKKSNRSRLNRLARVGPVRYAELTSRSDFEKHMADIAAYCDLRQGAVNGDCPFHDDPYKAEFFSRLSDCPELVHGSVLMAGNVLAAYHIGLRNRDEVCLGLISHSPFLAEHSPGKLLLLHLIADLADRGVARFDLTPGGEYKERFQNSHDTAYTLTFFASGGDALRARGRVFARGKIKSALSRARMDPKNSEKRFRYVLGRLSNPTQLPIKAMRLVRKRISSAEEMRFYALDPAWDPRLGVRGPQIQFAVNRIQDLILYEPADADAPSRQRFLSDCLSRLGAGERVFTCADGGRLLHSAWLAERVGRTPSGVGNNVNMPPNSYVLWDSYTHPGARGHGLQKASIRVRAEYARALGASVILVNVYADNASSRNNIEKLGFRYFGSMTRRWTLGRANIQWTSNLNHDFPELAAFA